MRVAIVLPGFQTDENDWCIPAFTNLIRSLAARPEVEVVVFALRYPHRQDEYTVNGARVVSFGGGPIFGRRVFAASLGLLWQRFLATLEHEHKQEPFVVVHGFWATESGYLAVHGAKRIGVPSLVHLSGGELAHLTDIGYGNLRAPLAGALVRRSLLGANTITVPSTSLMHLLEQHFPAASSHAVPWSLGVDCAMFAPAATQEANKTLRIAHVASLLPVKDQNTLLRGVAAAANKAPDTKITLSIAGTGPLRAKLKKQSADLGITDRVTFCGDIPHDQLPAFYRKHDLFALTSRHEAQCMAALEAMACGLPWVAPPVGSLADAVSSGGGWSFPVGEATALADAILMAASDAEERRRRGDAARHWVRENFELEGVVDMLLGLYKAVELAGRPRIRHE